MGSQVVLLVGLNSMAWITLLSVGRHILSPDDAF